MKIKCGFCGTNFRGRQCPACGLRAKFAARRQGRGGAKLFLALVALAATAGFALLSLNAFDRQKKAESLIIAATEIKRDGGQILVSGVIKNISGRTMSLPEIAFVFQTDDGENRIIRHPPRPLLEQNARVQFSHRLTAPDGAKNLSVQFDK